MTSWWRVVAPALTQGEHRTVLALLLLLVRLAP